MARLEQPAEPLGLPHALQAPDCAANRVDVPVRPGQFMPERAIRKLPDPPDSGIRSGYGQRSQIFVASPPGCPSQACRGQRATRQVHARHHAFPVHRILAPAMQAYRATWARTVPVVADVVDPETRRDQSGGQFPAGDMCRYVHAVPVELPVSGGLDYRHRPRPALIGAKPLDGCPVPHVIRRGPGGGELCSACGVLPEVMAAAQVPAHVASRALIIRDPAGQGFLRGKRSCSPMSRVVALAEAASCRFSAASRFIAIGHTAKISQKLSYTYQLTRGRRGAGQPSVTRKGERI